jgi:hypothetical protein
VNARRRPILPALLLVAVLLGSGHLLAAPAAASDWPKGPSTCVPEPNQLLHPDVVLLGETIRQTITLKVRCAGYPTPPLHIALVLDNSAAVTDRNRAMTREVATAVVRGLNLEHRPLIRLGVVFLGESGRRTCALTNDTDVLIPCIEQGMRWEAEEPAGDLGFRGALIMLDRGQHYYEGPHSWIGEIIVLITDGTCVPSCDDARRAARLAKDSGILIMAECVSHDCDQSCLSGLASSGRHFFPFATWIGITERLRWSDPEPIYVVPRSLTITGTLPATTLWVPDLTDPSPDGISADGRTLSWRVNYVPHDGITITVGLRPGRLGHHAAGLATTGHLVDSFRFPVDFAFPEPPVLVLGPP